MGWCHHHQIDKSVIRVWGVFRYDIPSSLAPQPETESKPAPQLGPGCLLLATYFLVVTVTVYVVRLCRVIVCKIKRMYVCKTYKYFFTL